MRPAALLYHTADLLILAAIDQGATLSRTYEVSALATLIVIDRSGKVTYPGHRPLRRPDHRAVQKAGAK